jgi:hypothetical protein
MTSRAEDVKALHRAFAREQAAKRIVHDLAQSNPHLPGYNPTCLFCDYVPKDPERERSLTQVRTEAKHHHTDCLWRRAREWKRP